MGDAVLDKMFSKSDFSNLKIVGQFNKGFILATRPSMAKQNDAQVESKEADGTGDISEKENAEALKT